MQSSSADAPPVQDNRNGDATSGGGGEAMYDFPEFEAFEPDDRPSAPSAEDFPVGCCVELVDAAAAAVAQTPMYWEPFMAQLFRPQRTVWVRRHQGDYTFVECDLEDGGIRLGCTLYRACLKEPKVKMKKYIPKAESEDSVALMMGSGKFASLLVAEPSTEEGLFPLVDGGATVEDDAFNVEVPPSSDDFDSAPLATATAIPTPPPPPPPSPLAVHLVSSGRMASNPLATGSSSSSPPHSASRPSGSGASGSRAEGGHYVRMPPPPPPPTQAAVAGGGGSSSAASSHAGVPSIVLVAKAKKLIRRGNLAFADKKNDVAIKLYTEALELDRSDQARVLSNRSAAYLASRNAEAALADARHVMRLAPRSHVGYVRAGNVFRQLKRFDEAKMCYEKALALDPLKSHDLQYSLISNAVAGVYRARTEHLPISINLSKQMRLIGTAKRACREGECVWTEQSAIVTPIDDSDAQHTSNFCAQCFRAFANAEALAALVPGVDASMMQSLVREIHPVTCHEQCGERYCSDVCRAKAWTEHHWIECASKGRWAQSVSTIRDVLSRAAARGVDSTLLASVRLALRMLVRVLSSGKQLSEAVNAFSWLQEKALTAEEQVVASSVLQPAYLAVYECLTREERALLDYSFAVGLFKRCRQNMVPVMASLSHQLRSNAEMNLTMLRDRGGRHPGLEAVVCLTPQQLAPWTISCWVVYELYSVILEPSAHSMPGCERNIGLRQVNECATTAVLLALKPIEKFAQLVGTRPQPSTR